MGYEMKTRSAACSVPQLLASVGLGALGAVLCLPPHEQAWRGFVCVTVWIAEQSWFTGQWTEVGWVQVSVSWARGERFPEVAAGWGHFLHLALRT